ncbi:unnamed protein product [Arctogadus glacialis]
MSEWCTLCIVEQNRECRLRSRVSASLSLCLSQEPERRFLQGCVCMSHRQCSEGRPGSTEAAVGDVRTGALQAQAEQRDQIMTT